jgi:hypothetical protein
MRKCMSLTESIVSLSKNVITPFQIGLTLQLYHEFGSKQLVDTLHVHGFCSSYDEVKRYLTSFQDCVYPALKYMQRSAKSALQKEYLSYH